MKTRFIPVYASVVLFCCSGAHAYTVTFDDVPTGQDLSRYYEMYGLSFIPGWEVADHSASGWGPPHSGANIVRWNGNPGWATGFGFGVDGVSEYTVSLVGAYFSTELGVVVRMAGHGVGGAEVASVTIGAPGASWSNRYVEIASESGSIAGVQISGVGSQEDRYHFCLDDLTVVPVPEPSTLAFLSLALASVGIGVARRRR